MLAPELRAAFHLSLGETGVVLGSVSIGATPTLLLWGLLADRIGERIVLASGLAGGAAAVAGAAFAHTYPALVGLLALSGASAASVNAASGRAVMVWWPRSRCRRSRTPRACAGRCSPWRSAAGPVHFQARCSSVTRRPTRSWRSLGPCAIRRRG